MFVEIVGILGIVVGVIASIVGIFAFIFFAVETNERNRQMTALAEYLNIKFSECEKVIEVIELPDEPTDE